MKHNNYFGVSADPNNLRHWKYIRKYKKNGKWRYVYPNDKFGVKNFIDTKITGKAYRQNAQELSGELIDTGNRAFDARQNRIHKEQTSKEYSKTNPEVVRAKMLEASLSRKYNKLKSEETGVYHEYYTQSLKGISEVTINKGKKKVASLLKSLADKIDS